MHNLTRNAEACHRGSPVLLPVLVAALLVTGTGCRMALPERPIEAKVHPQQDFAVNQHQVRLRMRALVDPMCGAIEQTADAISAGTTNRTVQQAALHWKIVSDHRGSNSKAIDFERIEICPIFAAKIENTAKSNT